jgi:putative flippase GtrA
VLAGALVAGATSVAAHDVPLRLGLLLAIVLGILTAFVVDRRTAA